MATNQTSPLPKYDVSLCETSRKQGKIDVNDKVVKTSQGNEANAIEIQQKTDISNNQPYLQ